MKTSKRKKRGQSAIEYIVLATTITIIVLIGFDEDQGILLKARNISEKVFNETLRGIMGTNSVGISRTQIKKGDVGGYP